MIYTAVNVYQQQETGHWGHQNYYTVGIDLISWEKLSGDWPWPFSPI